MEVHRGRRLTMPGWWRVVMCVAVVVAGVVLLSRAVASSGHSARVGGVTAKLRTSEGTDKEAMTDEVRDWTLVVYVYWEKDATYAENLRYFLRVGTGTAEESKRDRVEYLIIVQGEILSVTVPPHVKVWRRPNTCYDFGAVGEALRNLPLPAFRYYVILNPSAKGPYLPAYWPSKVHWSTIFTSRLNDRVKQVGTSIVCLPPKDLGGWGPRIEGFAWATDHVGMKLGLERGVFDCFGTKEQVILKGEYGMSRTLLGAGYTLDTLQLKYQGVNWTDTTNWNCNNNKHPTRANAYEGISMHPLETVFHKKSWTDSPVEVLPEYLERYSRWKYDELERHHAMRRHDHQRNKTR